MKRYILLILCVIAAAGAAPAQINFDRIKRDKPDLAKIKKEINDRTSPYYYPRLMEEFERNDTVMKLDKYRYLYLGYALQEDYNPYRVPAVSVDTELMFRETRLTPEECKQVVNDAQMSLKDNPFNLEQMAILIQALKQTRNEELAKIWQYKYNYILMAIVSTGTGLDEENAWYVIEPQHEYMLLNAMGYMVTEHIFYSPYYELLKVADNSGREVDEYTFNIQLILQEYYRKFPEELEEP
ncbi:MAG: DUF4919 domain-containing protein [Paramuribaculum sp.]|nr:DUF4919 domain-containing protein [Paramuribaculum sp.]